jgi:hypothetical protein
MEHELKLKKHVSYLVSKPKVWKKKQQMWEPLKAYLDLVHGKPYFLWEIILIKFF